jgi:hypothetical protein
MTKQDIFARFNQKHPMKKQALEDLNQGAEKESC